MRDSLARQLIAMNKDFYEKIGPEFNITRSYSWDGWSQLADIFAAQNFKPETILDLGCGNGRFLKFAREHFPVKEYLGLDSSNELLKFAHRDYDKLNPGHKLEFRQWDLFSDPDKDPVLISRKYDLIVAMGVMHHIPGQKLRQQFLDQAKSLLAQEGRLVVTFWDFLSNPQLEKKIEPWEAAGLYDQEMIKELEAGHDYLLGWNKKGASGSNYRYCHYYTETEINDLCQAAGLNIETQFLADGPGDDSNCYVILSLQNFI